MQQAISNQYFEPGNVLRDFHLEHRTLVGSLPPAVALEWLERLKSETARQELDAAYGTQFHTHIHSEEFVRWGWKNHSAVVVTANEDLTVAVWYHDDNYFLVVWPIST